MGQSDVILGTCWGTNWELKEDVESVTYPHPPPKKQFDLLCAWFTSLVAKNFYAYMCFLPFSV
jgi:hypothetical protein